MYDIINCGISKNCVEAFQRPLPGTRSNSAAIHLLASSTPGEFHWEITFCPSAFHALTWICNKFQGGHNRAINGEWFRRFTQEGMTREETLEQYVQRKVALFRSLHPMHLDDLPMLRVLGALRIPTCRSSIPGQHREVWRAARTWETQVLGMRKAWAHCTRMSQVEEGQQLGGR